MLPISFPRVRGDVPVTHITQKTFKKFSPRARGCSDPYTLNYLLHHVFPACAGMFLLLLGTGRQKPCFPRVRGDVPAKQARDSRIVRFSPRARGCSFDGYTTPSSTLVFPACAGMFLWSRSFHESNSSFPRVRGDVPVAEMLIKDSQAFSPRARGCSSLGTFRENNLGVFPACAGMFLLAVLFLSKLNSFPRVRGDVPVGGLVLIQAEQFSPRARGCSWCWLSPVPKM